MQAATLLQDFKSNAIVLGTMATKNSRAAGAAIARYLARHQLSQKQFADLLGVTQGAVSQWILGGKISEDNRTEIMRVTNGEVPAEVLFPRVFSARAA